MNINLRRMAVIALLTFCSTAISSTAAQERTQPRTRTIARIRYGGDMAALISHLPETYGVTIGLETDPQKPHSYIEVSVDDATLIDVLNAIVKAEPRYGWRASGDFIEVFPVAGSTPLLDVMIRNFEVTNVDQSEAINTLMNLSEVQSAMKAMTLRSRTLSGSPEVTDEKFSLKLDAVMLRTALHRIAKASGQFWIFRQDAAGVVTIANSIK